MCTEHNAGDLAETILVIPALDPDPALPEYASSLLALGAAQVVVIDDGSGPDFTPTFRALEELEGCTLLRHEKNCGKGRALKTAFSHIRGCAQWEGAVVVTADADGQHSVEDVCAVARAAREETGRLVLGVRDLGLDNVPTRSKIGNRVTSWAFHLLYGVRLEDTQTGLRGIPWGLLDWCCAIGGERYEYEMNMLIKAAREHVALGQVGIETIYYNNNEGTHLHTVRDAWRVFCVLISGLGVYTLCSALSAATDVLTFWLGSSVLFAFLPKVVCYWWSTVMARALSSAVDYTLNHIYFGSKRTRRNVVRYYSLWACQMLCSYCLLLVVHALLPGVPAVVSKAAVDVVLALFSYQIQLHWVFREEGVHGAG